MKGLDFWQDRNDYVFKDVCSERNRLYRCCEETEISAKETIAGYCMK